MLKAVGRRGTTGEGFLALYAFFCVEWEISKRREFRVLVSTICSSRVRRCPKRLPRGKRYKYHGWVLCVLSLVSLKMERRELNASDPVRSSESFARRPCLGTRILTLMAPVAAVVRPYVMNTIGLIQNRKAGIAVG